MCAGCGHSSQPAIVAISAQDAGPLPVIDSPVMLDASTGVQQDNVAIASVPDEPAPVPLSSRDIIAQLMTRSDTGFEALVSSVDSFGVPDIPYVKTNIHFENDVILKGAPGKLYSIDGGTLADVSVLAPHSPRFEIGKVFLVFTKNGSVSESFQQVSPTEFRVGPGLITHADILSVAKQAGQ
jgi:hypothetical protein